MRAMKGKIHEKLKRHNGLFQKNIFLIYLAVSLIKIYVYKLCDK
jgi:hypothetical protein